MSRNRDLCPFLKKSLSMATTIFFTNYNEIITLFISKRLIKKDIFWLQKSARFLFENMKIEEKLQPQKF